MTKQIATTLTPATFDTDIPFDSNPLPLDVQTPINVHNLAQALTKYPNRNLANYLINGFTRGFDIGYSGKQYLVCSYY